MWARPAEPAGAGRGHPFWPLTSFPLRHLVDVLSRLHRFRPLPLGIADGVSELIGLLDQEPARLPPAAYPGQRVTAAQFLAVQVEADVPALDRRRDGNRPTGRVLGAVVVGAGVPDDDRSRAVLARREHALEVLVVTRVVLRLDREPLLRGVRGRALGHRP